MDNTTPTNSELSKRIDELTEMLTMLFDAVAMLDDYVHRTGRGPIDFPKDFPADQMERVKGYIRAHEQQMEAVDQ